MPTFRLLSVPMMSAPGLVRWAANGYAFPRDRAAMVRVISNGWNVPAPAVHALLSGAAPYEIGADETVTFQWPRPRLTQAKVKAELAARGITFRRTEYGEYRVNFRHGGEESAAYDSDLESARDTGLAMADSRSRFSPLGRHRTAALYQLDSYRGRA